MKKKGQEANIVAVRKKKNLRRYIHTGMELTYKRNSIRGEACLHEAGHGRRILLLNTVSVPVKGQKEIRKGSRSGTGHIVQ
jgi:hypothetical protein